MSASSPGPGTAVMTADAIGGSEVATRAETTAVGVAEQARAEMTAAVFMARQYPRDWESVRSLVLKECDRSSFAKVAKYILPFGDNVQGPSIRFAEACVRLMGNIRITTQVVYDDEEKCIVRLNVLELEAMSSSSKDFVVVKTVERKFARKGEEPIRKRYNNAGEQLYIYAATPQEVLMMTNSAISKAYRTEVMRFVPGDIVDEAMKRIDATATSDLEKDPDAAWKGIADGFVILKVPIQELVGYMGQPLATCNAFQLVELRALYTAIKNGDATWADALTMRAAERQAEAGIGGGDDGTEVAVSGAPQKLRDGIAAKVAAAKEPPKDDPKDDAKGDDKDKKDPPKAAPAKVSGSSKPSGKRPSDTT